MVQALQALGVVVALEGGLLIHGEALARARTLVSDSLKRDGEITVAEFRHADWQQPQMRYGAFGSLRC